MNNKKPEDLLDDLLDRLIGGEFDVAVLRTLPQEGIEDVQPHLEASFWLQSQGQKLSPPESFERDTWRFMKLRLKHESKLPTFWPRIRNTWTHSFWQRLFWRRVALPATVVMLFILVVIGPTLVSAAQEAMPGDRLYAVKLSIEKVQLVFALSEEEEIRLLSEHATERLKEAQRAAETIQIEDLEIALQAYQETTSKYLNMLGLVDRQEIAPIADELDQTALEQVHILEILTDSVTNLDLQNRYQVQSALEASLENASTFQEWLTQADPTDIPPVIKTPTPTPVPFDQNWASPTPRQDPPKETGTPGSWRVTATPTSDSITNWPTPSTTASIDGSKPSYNVPTESSDQTS